MISDFEIHDLFRDTMIVYREVLLYKDLTNYYFVPVAVETFGAWGSQGLKLIKEIGRKICDVTGEKRSTFYLLQNISMAIQRGNAACIVGTVPVSDGLEEVFDFVENTSEN